MADQTPIVKLPPQSYTPWYEEMDETIAILGVIIIGLSALYICKPDTGVQIASNVVSGLIGYVGRGRANSK